MWSRPLLNNERRKELSVSLTPVPFLDRAVKGAHWVAAVHLSKLLRLCGFLSKKKKNNKHLTEYISSLSHRQKCGINLRHDFDLTSWCLVTSLMQESRPQDEDVLPHRYGTIRHKLTTSGDHRSREQSLCCNSATVLSVCKSIFQGRL